MNLKKYDQCPCGSGNIYGDCCSGKRNFVQRGMQITFSSLHPVIEGLDDMPDLKHILERELTKCMFSEDSEPEKVVYETVKNYNELMDIVNKKLPEPYGDMIHKAKRLLEEKRYDGVINTTDIMLAAYPESIDANEIKDCALFVLQKHPLQTLFTKIMKSNQKERLKLLEELHETTFDSSSYSRIEIFHMTKALYSSESWENRYLALDILKNVWFLTHSLDKGHTNEIYDFIVKALCDDDGRVRKNAFYCVSHVRLLDTPFELFFMLYETGKKEKGRKQHNICRALLELVSPATDKDMYSAGLYKRYRKVIEFALKITNYDPEYFMADPLQKMKMRFLEPKRRLLKAKKKR